MMSADELAPLLLNEMQREEKAAAAVVAVQAAEIRDLKQQQKRFATRAEVQDLKQQLQAALLKLHTQDELAAKR